MSLREKLLSGPKKPLHKIEIDGDTYYLRHPTIGAQDAARVAGGVSVDASGKSQIGNMPKFQASLLISLAVDEGNHPLFEATDMAAMCEAEIGSPLAKLMAEAVKLIGEANEAGKNSTAPTEAA